MAFHGDCLRVLRAMLEVESAWVRQLTKGRHRISDPNPGVHREDKEAWVGPPTGAEGFNKSITHFK